MKIYTKTGDKGETALLGGKRVKKSCIEMEAIGEVDELNASLGLLISFIGSRSPGTVERLSHIQNKLFTVGSNLAAVQTELVNVPRLAPKDIEELEHWIDAMERELAELTQFILPDGDMAAAQSFYARAVCRRAERKINKLSDHYEFDPLIARYTNRLSDALFVLARYINFKSGRPETAWEK